MKTFKSSLILQANALILFILFILIIPVNTSSYCNPAGIQTISLIAPGEILKNPVTRTTIDDVLQLLGKGFRNLDISLNNRDAGIQIILGNVSPDSQAGSSRFIKGRVYDYLRYPDHEYQWDSSCKDGTIILRLSSPSFEGMSFGLYGLLQEKLGVKFYPSYRKQIDATLAWLFRVPWDFVTVDFTMGEYLPDLATVMPETKKYMWSDMVTMKRIGVDNHLTFSSGWEWGYWLTDWSIARWSWNYTEDGTLKKSHPLSILLDLFPDPDLQQSWEEALQLQKYYLKQLGLIPFLSALDPSSEFPRPFNKPFQPRGLRLHTDGFLRRPLMQR
ncbi:MAG: hypothetical protein IEMM0007_0223 [bacterium]|nr:MAG: hypothetical protein IEMM0007_0223 [bacterium]